MDILNDYYPLYPENPETSSLSESDIEENDKYISKLDSINNSRKRKKNLSFNDFCTKHSDNMWYIWCIINDYSQGTGLLDNLDYPAFCALCYENSTRY
jgi:hypothetical protein